MNKIIKEDKEIEPVKVLKECKVQKTNLNYINNKEFLEELKVYNSYFSRIMELLDNPKDKDLDSTLKRVYGNKESNLWKDVDSIFKNKVFVNIKERLGEKFIKIASNYMNRPSFINYTTDRKNDMISDAVFIMYKYAHKFDTTKENPFAYFTLMTHNAFIKNISDVNVIAETHDSISKLEMLHHQNAQLTDFLDD